MSERPDLERIGASLDSGAWDEHDLLELLREVLVDAVQVEQDHADYAEHTAVSHRYMVDEVDRLERELAEARERGDEARQKLAELVVIAEQRTSAGQAQALGEIARLGRSALALLAAAP